MKMIIVFQILTLIGIALVAAELSTDRELNIKCFDNHDVRVEYSYAGITGTVYCDEVVE